MKQLLQSLNTGIGKVVEVPSPAPMAGHLLIATSRTLVSAGTERMLVDFGKANVLAKVLQQPDKVRDVLVKFQTDGLIPTLEAVRSKLDQPLALGYCNAGVVIHSETDGFKKGDRVVSNGNHAEIVRVPRNICAKIPSSVDDESASFAPLAAIGLQGIRLAQPTLGECFAVQGLGLIGLMTVQMLRANGCRVLGIDFDSSRCDLARQLGATVVNLSEKEDPLAVATEFSRGNGMDGVLICVSSKSNEVISQAAQMCRKRGRVVLIGVAGLNLRRDDFYKKEINFQVSASYGPGRYDPSYEELGNDYPIGFVRWTLQRNFDAVLDMMESGSLDVKPLITHRVAIKNAEKAYEILEDPAALGIVIEYPENASVDRTVLVPSVNPLLECRDIKKNTSAVIGLIGAGNYSSRMLIPALKRTNAELDTIASDIGVSGAHHAHKAGFARATTDLDTIFYNTRINTVFIATRHHSHASQVVAALKAGKHVFVEKPLCITLEELQEIRVAAANSNLRSNNLNDAIYEPEASKRIAKHFSPDSVTTNIQNKSRPILMVGFNRRFSPHIKKIKELLCSVTAPRSFVVTVNAGEIPHDHWTQDIRLGGGRVIGEACHFIDLLRFLADAQIVEYSRSFMGTVMRDTVTITLKFANDSIGTIHYFANGSKAFPKERLEIFTDGHVLVLDNFRKLYGYGWPNFSKMNLWRQDKGQAACVKAFIDNVRAPQIAMSNDNLIPIEEIFEVAEVTIKLAS